MLSVHYPWPEFRHHDDEDPVYHENSQQGGQNHEPEPDEDVSLLVDDIERQDTKAVMGLDGTRRTIFVEDAFGHSGEYVDHRIDPVILGSLREVHHPETV